MCKVDPDPAVYNRAVLCPSGRKKSCTGQSLLKIIATVPGVHSSPGSCVYSRVCSGCAEFFPIVQVNGLISYQTFQRVSTFFPTWTTRNSSLL
ncbi:hypothetical protein PoB_005940700 [Plakobranchus ocellatus]|uniref:Uncharacterized protein n=1 Tax=Plakobranchus ocellatus TaxID=259542 RepID=A0AAV4CMD5_9GAST|nr:hypothetical protein PoB_005940700 [Plakobranchus ocellatus]